MRSVKTEAGIVNIENLQTAKRRNLHLMGWVIEIHYSNKKEPILLECTNEEEAKKCEDQIFEAMNEKPTTGTVTITR
jgi:hypothetical protein